MWLHVAPNTMTAKSLEDFREAPVGLFSPDTISDKTINYSDRMTAGV